MAERPCEDAACRQLAARHGEKLRRKPAPLTPCSWTSGYKPENKHISVV